MTARSARNACLAILAALLLAGGAAVASPAGPQSSPGAELAARSPWLPWLGCWRLQNQQTEGQEERIQGERLVCVTPAQTADTARMVTLVDGTPVLERTLTADGLDRPFDEGGCSGQERVSLLSEGRRVLTVSETRCAGGARRRTDGLELITDSDTWLDIQLVDVEGQPELSVRRYRSVPAGAALRRYSEPLSGLATALAAARLRASEPLGVGDVIESVHATAPALVEAMLVQTRASFQLNANTLLHAADAGVPPSVIDLMVALSFPDYFVVDSVEPEVASAARPPAAAAYPAAGPYPGYWSAWFAPFGYGYYYPQPYFLIHPGTHFGGKVVAGHGYARVRTSPNAPRGGILRFLSGGKKSSGGASGGSSGGSVTKSGARKGSGHGTRKAKPRGQH